MFEPHADADSVLIGAGRVFHPLEPESPLLGTAGGAPHGLPELCVCAMEDAGAAELAEVDGQAADWSGLVDAAGAPHAEVLVLVEAEVEPHAGVSPGFEDPDPVVSVDFAGEDDEPDPDASGFELDVPQPPVESPQPTLSVAASPHPPPEEVSLEVPHPQPELELELVFSFVVLPTLACLELDTPHVRLLLLSNDRNTRDQQTQ